MRSQPIIIAHRGLHDAAPENSARAFRLAAEEGFQWAECDVWASSDGMPVVIHDETLERTTQNRGRVSQFRGEELSRIRLKRGLTEALSILPQVCFAVGQTCGLLVEIKPRHAVELTRNTIEVLRRFAQVPYMVQSFDPDNIRLASLIDASIPVAMLVQTDAQLQRAIIEKWTAIHSDHQLLTQEVVDAIHSSGGTVGAWTVNLDADIRRMIELGVDRIITDEPRRAREWAATVTPE